MRLKGWRGGIVGAGLLLVLMVGLLPVSARAAFLYKSYIIRKAGGRDILCDPYLVQKNDYILKIFRQRGEISQTDFPEFLRIFKLINPRVKNIDRILPGQNILIPLKKLKPGSLPNQASGVVTIPFVTGSDIDTLLKNNANAYRIRSGDTVSRLLSVNFGRYGTRAYREGLSIFKALNPQIKDMNFIVAGQKILLPRKSLRNRPWYESLFDTAGNVAELTPVNTGTGATTSGETTSATPKGPGIGKGPAPSPLLLAASVLDGKVYQKGIYFFPRPGLSDLRLDLSQFPILETGDGVHVLIIPSGSDPAGLAEEDRAVLKNFWKDLVVARQPAGAPRSQLFAAVMNALSEKTNPGKRVFTDGEVKVSLQARWMIDQRKSGKPLAVTAIKTPGEETPQPVLDYLLKKFGITLKEPILSGGSGYHAPKAAASVSLGQVPALDASRSRRAFVRDLYSVIGATYEQNATISFPYAGVQVQASANVLYRSNSLPVLIDFGGLQGDAIAAIEKTGFSVLQVSLDGKVTAQIPELLRAAGMTCDTGPTFTAAKRAGTDNETISLPGFLARDKDRNQGVLLTTASLDADLIRFLNGKNIQVVSLLNVSGG